MTQPAAHRCVDQWFRISGRWYVDCSCGFRTSVGTKMESIDAFTQHVLEASLATVQEVADDMLGGAAEHHDEDGYWRGVYDAELNYGEQLELVLGAKPRTCITFPRKASHLLEHTERTQ